MRPMPGIGSSWGITFLEGMLDCDRYIAASRRAIVIVKTEQRLANRANKRLQGNLLSSIGVERRANARMKMWSHLAVIDWRPLAAVLPKLGAHPRTASSRFGSSFRSSSLIAKAMAALASAARTQAINRAGELLSA